MRVRDDAIGVAVTRLPVELMYGAHGKPGLCQRFVGSQLRFDVSHSEDAAVCTCAPGREVEINVEAMRVIRDADDSVARFFSRREKQAYLARNPRDGPQGLFNFVIEEKK